MSKWVVERELAGRPMYLRLEDGLAERLMLLYLRHGLTPRTNDEMAEMLEKETDVPPGDMAKALSLTLKRNAFRRRLVDSAFPVPRGEQQRVWTTALGREYLANDEEDATWVAS